MKEKETIKMRMVRHLAKKSKVTQPIRIIETICIMEKFNDKLFLRFDDHPNAVMCYTMFVYSFTLSYTLLSMTTDEFAYANASDYSEKFTKVIAYIIR